MNTHEYFNVPLFISVVIQQLEVHPTSFSSAFTHLTRDLGTLPPVPGCNSFLEGRAGDHRKSEINSPFTACDIPVRKTPLRRGDAPESASF
jgi:hypothetical protein